MLKRVVRAGHDRFVRTGCRLSPRATFAVVAAGGTLAQSFGLFGFRPGEVNSIYAGRATSSASRIARRMAAASARLEAIDVYCRGRTADVERLVEWNPSPNDVRGPAVLIGLHAGPIFALRAALQMANLSVLSLVSAERQDYAGMAERVTTRTAGDAVAAVERAQERLRDGGLVLIFVDGDFGALMPPVPLLGRLVTFRRGAFRLARLTGAPIRPVTIVWAGGRRPIRASIGDPLAIADGCGPEMFEARAAEAAAARFEQYLLAHPHEYHRGKFQTLLEAARA